MTERMNETWRAAGVQAGREWLRSIDPALPVAPQVAACVAHAAPKAGGIAKTTAWGVVQLCCVWAASGHTGTCQEGCDAWFDSAIGVVNEALGTRVRAQTLQSMATGEATCARRIWDENL